MKSLILYTISSQFCYLLTHKVFCQLKQSDRYKCNSRISEFASKVYKIKIGNAETSMDIAIAMGLTKEHENPTLTLILSLRERRLSYPLPFKGRDRVGMGLFSDEPHNIKRFSKDPDYSFIARPYGMVIAR